MNVRELRQRLGLTQQQLADRLGVNQATVSRLETGALPIDKRTELALHALSDGSLPTAKNAA